MISQGLTFEVFMATHRYANCFGFYGKLGEIIFSVMYFF